LEKGDIMALKNWVWDAFKRRRGKKVKSGNGGWNFWHSAVVGKNLKKPSTPKMAK